MRSKFLRYLPVFLLATVLMAASVKVTKAEAKVCLVHSWQAATCTTPKTCKKCGKPSGSSLGHIMSWVVTKPAKCNENGVKCYKCSRSGCSYCPQTQSIPKTNNHTPNISAATCIKAKVCTVCGAELQKALGHNMQWVVKVKATCEKDGRKDYECSRCKQYQMSQNITKLGHSYNVPKATCTVNKYCTRSDCGKVVEYATGHNYVWRTTKSPTCTATGVETELCSNTNCTDKRNTRTLKALGHEYRYTYTSATCEEPGYKTTTCARGDMTPVKSQNQSPLGHVRTVVTAAADGTLTSVCGRDGCGKPYTIGTAPKLEASTYTSNIKLVLEDIANGNSAFLTVGNDECKKVWSWYYSKNSNSTEPWCVATASYLMSIAGVNMNKVQAVANTNSSAGTSNALINVTAATKFYQRYDSSAKNDCFYPLPGYTTNSLITTSNRGSFSSIKTGDILTVDNPAADFGHIGMAYVAANGKKYIIHGNWDGKMCMNEIKEEKDGKVRLYYTNAGEYISGYADIQTFLLNNDLGVMYSLSTSAGIPKYTIGSYTLGGYKR